MEMLKFWQRGKTEQTQDYIPLSQYQPTPSGSEEPHDGGEEDPANHAEEKGTASNGADADSAYDSGSESGSGSGPEAEDGEGGGHDMGFRFWAVLSALALSRLMVGLEYTIAATALPTVVNSLHMGPSYLWIQNAPALTSAIASPLLGQLADLFGRRRLAVSVVAIFSAGGLVSGSATSGGVLVFGRAVQGGGGGGINLMSNIILSDLVPLRDRGKYIALVLTVFMVGAALGPLVGGALVQTGGQNGWRWVFWLPVAPGLVCLVLLSLFVPAEPPVLASSSGSLPRSSASGSVNHLPPRDNVWAKIRSIDYPGNLLIIGSTTSMLVALTYGGAQYPWASLQVVLPLVLGTAGLVAFAVVEGLLPVPALARFTSTNPVLPPRLLFHRTGAIVAANAFLSALVSNWTNFFLSVYFQGVRQSDPAAAGLQLLPTVLVTVPAAIVSVWLLSKTGRYKFLHLTGFFSVTVTLALFAVRLDRRSSDSAVILLESVYAAGIGTVVNALLPAFQAGVAESDQATATATFSFLRGLAGIWSLTIPAAIFNNRCGALVHRIPDDAVRADLSHGKAYEHATAAYLAGLPEDVRDIVIDVLIDALRTVWVIAAACAGFALVLAVFERDIPLRKKLRGPEEKDVEDERRAGGI
ncbi:major facilitator superfamily transporter [Diaporthe helianthi]|uniref:Major facilitator superfamily transporter n=1 Tax=Diaporthe helianthi TaxID=158607 RepID=A0A2P5HZY9_DIAHE|nr:major facilitator superfamily transporter [Diaporthe helianthi]